jgi:hypothetical protein
LVEEGAIMKTTHTMALAVLASAASDVESGQHSKGTI